MELKFFFQCRTFYLVCYLTAAGANFIPSNEFMAYPGQLVRPIHEFVLICQLAERLPRSGRVRKQAGGRD